MVHGSGTRKLRRRGIQALRIMLVVSVLLLIHLRFEQMSAKHRVDGMKEISPETIREFLPEAETVASDGMASLLDASGETVGYAMQTSPQADDIIGFSGPTNVLLVFNDDWRLLGLKILESGDTPSHVEQIRRDTKFLLHFNGKSKKELATQRAVDGTSGATLTALAIQKSISRELGGRKGIPIYYPPPTLNAVRKLFPDADHIVTRSPSEFAWTVMNTSGKSLGTVLSTMSASQVQSNTIGYQGPTDTLIGLDLDGRVVGIVPDRTYDNEEFVYYVRMDDYFLSLFNGSTVDELSELDLQEAGIEGVSGATKTSMAMAREVIRTARAEQLYVAGTHHDRYSYVKNFLIDMGTLALVSLALIVAMTRLRRRRIGRIVLPAFMVAYLGFFNGDMVSLALIAGWARHGLPFLDIGLLVLCAVAFVLPMATRHNVYCHHICPHGALQQLLRRVTKRRYRLNRRLASLLSYIPGILLAVCVLVAMSSTKFSLVNLEAFDAWIFQVAGWATILIAIVGLVASLFVPMAYCRYGCPTGFLLNFLRLNARSDKWSRIDWAALGLAGVSLGLWCLG